MTPSPLPHGAIPIAAGETMSPEVQREYRKMQEFVYGCTVAIRVDSQNQTEIDVGSGVVIEIGNRTFVASAGHVLSKNPYVLFGKIQSIELGAKPKQFSQRQFRDPPDDGTPMTHVLDIGFLEVPNDSHPTICFFKSLVDLQPPNETLTMLVGHPIDAPGSLADPKWATQGRYELIRTAHSAIMQEVRNNKFVFAYPKDVLDLDSKTGKMTEAKSFKTPKGFSGGGLWVQRTLSATELDYPGNRYRLLGLDYAWCPQKREVYCVPIRYWVRLVYDHYPDLHDIIKEQFPKIESVNLSA